MTAFTFYFLTELLCKNVICRKYRTKNLTIKSLKKWEKSSSIKGNLEKITPKFLQEK